MDVVATAIDDISSPVWALRHHLLINRDVPSSAPLFAYASPDRPSGWAPLTRDWFLTRCHEVWRAADLPSLSGHCFRIGGATELLLRGTPPDVVALQGGWRSRAFLQYWRKIDTILPVFISDSFDRARLDLVRDAMVSFCRKVR